ncbi:hypothetical protein TGMAS_232035 [Toxoplasma gondii MAS]|uniref:Uncharacterized protein n=2 Tax=Toxoplasma gondii TaxID=5811 RepID=A0A086QXP6_TOXGO|nr:hypothetical protein TGP89_232035 [Toxoplasma gondii p89]KFH17378.1 hypothetical protein TGMAS_232035 [Toxoplasma gondii MAS]
MLVHHEDVRSHWRRRKFVCNLAACCSATLKTETLQGSCACGVDVTFLERSRQRIRFACCGAAKEESEQNLLFLHLLVLCQGGSRVPSPQRHCVGLECFRLHVRVNSLEGETRVSPETLLENLVTENRLVGGHAGSVP